MAFYPSLTVTRVWEESRMVKHVRTPKWCVQIAGRRDWFETFDARKASLCERALALHRGLQIGTRDTTWGEEIVTVDWAAQQERTA